MGESNKRVNRVKKSQIVKKRESNSLFTLSANQKEIYNYITKEFLTVKQIAKRKSSSVMSIYKTIERIRKKGFLFDPKIPTTKGESIGTRTTPPSQKFDSKLVRIHGYQYTISIIKNFKNYVKYMGNSCRFEGNLIKFWKDKIEVYQSPLSSFEGSTESETEIKALSYWNDFFHRVEAKFRLVLIKPGVDNIDIRKCHYAHLNNGVAHNYRVRKAKLKVRGSDSREWIIADYSHNIDELEFTNSETAGEDSRKVKKYLNDWRDNKPLTNSEIGYWMREMVKANAETNQGLNAAVGMIRSILDIIKPSPPTVAEELKEPPRYVG